MANAQLGQLSSSVSQTDQDHAQSPAEDGGGFARHGDGQPDAEVKRSLVELGVRISCDAASRQLDLDCATLKKKQGSGKIAGAECSKKLSKPCTYTALGIKSKLGERSSRTLRCFLDCS